MKIELINCWLSRTDFIRCICIVHSLSWKAWFINRLEFPTFPLKIVLIFVGKIGLTKIAYQFEENRRSRENPLTNANRCVPKTWPAISLRLWFTSIFHTFFSLLLAKLQSTQCLIKEISLAFSVFFFCILTVNCDIRLSSFEFYASRLLLLFYFFFYFERIHSYVSLMSE